MYWKFCNVLSPEICVLRKPKDINFKVSNMITNKNEVKTMTKHISFNCKCKFNSTTCNLNQKWNNKTCQRECKNYCTCKKDCSWNPSIGTCEDIKYLKSIADTSVMACDEIISVMNIASTKMKNTIAKKVTSTSSINCHCKKVRYKIDCYILHTAFLVIILPLLTTIICYHYAEHMSKY